MVNYYLYRDRKIEGESEDVSYHWRNSDDFVLFTFPLLLCFHEVMFASFVQFCILSFNLYMFFPLQITMQFTVCNRNQDSQDLI